MKPFEYPELKPACPAAPMCNCTGVCLQEVPEAQRAPEIEKNAAIAELQAQLAERDAQLVAERAMADKLAECIKRCLSDTEYRARNGMNCTTEIEEGGIVCFPWGNSSHAKLSVALHDYDATRQPTQKVAS